VAITWAATLREMTDIEIILDQIKWPRKNSELLSKGLIESKAGFKLPHDYVLFLSKYSGYESFLKDTYFVLWDETELLSLNEGYEVQNYLSNVLAIGSNGGGEMIGLKYRGNNDYKIVLLPFGSMEETEQQIIIGNSFIDFLRRMNDGKDWFKEVLGNR
jgi:hypothetical protein